VDSIKTTRHTRDDSEVILSTTVTAAMLEVYYVAAGYSVVNLRLPVKYCVRNYTGQNTQSANKLRMTIFTLLTQLFIVRVPETWRPSVQRCHCTRWVKAWL